MLFTIHSFAEFPQDYDDPIPNEHFEIIEKSEDGLSRDHWIFLLTSEITLSIFLEQWSRESRPTRRHKWEKVGDGYRRRLSDSWHHAGWMCPIKFVPMPDGVAEKLGQYVLQRCKIVLDEPGNRLVLGLRMTVPPMIPVSPSFPGC